MKKLLKPALLLAAIAVMVIGMLGSGAWFTSTAKTNTPEALKTGTLILNDKGVASFDLGDLSNMQPGDISDPVILYIKNDGSLPLAWIGNLVVDAKTADGAMLAQAIYIANATMEFSFKEPTDQFITNGKGSGAYPGIYNDMAAASKFGLVTLDKFDGTSGMGVQPQEFTGALKPTNWYKLTLQFGMAPLASNNYQNLSGLSLSFEVTATQVKAGAVEALHTPMLNNLGWYEQQLAKQN